MVEVGNFHYDKISALKSTYLSYVNKQTLKSHFYSIESIKHKQIYLKRSILYFYLVKC